LPYWFSWTGYLLTLPLPHPFSAWHGRLYSLQRIKHRDPPCHAAAPHRLRRAPLQRVRTGRRARAAPARPHLATLSYGYSTGTTSTPVGRRDNPPSTPLVAAGLAVVASSPTRCHPSAYNRLPHLAGPTTTCLFTRLLAPPPNPTLPRLPCSVLDWLYTLCRYEKWPRATTIPLPGTVKTCGHILVTVVYIVPPHYFFDTLENLHLLDSCRQQLDSRTFHTHIVFARDHPTLPHTAHTFWSH